MGRLAGKVAFITGAGSGIARAAARIFAREGAGVAIAELKPDLGQATEDWVRAAEGADAKFIHTDVTDETSVADAVAATVAHFGKLDILFNCAGGSVEQDASVTSVDLGVWDATQRLNLLGPFLCSRFALPQMQRAGGGSIVNMCSWGATRGDLGRHVYVAAKGGILSLTRALAYEYGKHNIRANAINCGTIRTERWKRRYENPDRVVHPEHEKVRKGLIERYPFSIGEPEDMARIALFLASDESRMITGTAIDADGGRSAW